MSNLWEYRRNAPLKENPLPIARPFFDTVKDAIVHFPITVSNKISHHSTTSIGDLTEIVLKGVAGEVLRAAAVFMNAQTFLDQNSLFLSPHH